MFKVEYFVQRDGIGLPLFTELPRRVLLGNWACGMGYSQKYSGESTQKKDGAQQNGLCPLAIRGNTSCLARRVASRIPRGTISP
jgi:hypothetical protein